MFPKDLANDAITVYIRSNNNGGSDPAPYKRVVIHGCVWFEENKISRGPRGENSETGVKILMPGINYNYNINNNINIVYIVRGETGYEFTLDPGHPAFVRECAEPFEKRHDWRRPRSVTERRSGSRNMRYTEIIC